MYAGQTSPFFSNIKSWEFLTFFIAYLADIAKYLVILILDISTIFFDKTIGAQSVIYKSLMADLLQDMEKKLLFIFTRNHKSTFP